MTVKIKDIIHWPIFYLKRIGSDTEFCLCLQVECTQIGLRDKASLCLRTKVKPTQNYSQFPVSEMLCF
jgi:hypothetical protein